MRSLVVMAILGASFLGCKSKEAVSSTTNAVQAAVVAATTGKVSHMYKDKGCSTVIFVSGADAELVLIPKDALPADLDVDGMEIKFNYRTLKMPQPQGCEKGIPAELTDISKK